MRRPPEKGSGDRQTVFSAAAPLGWTICVAETEKKNTAQIP
jgi:hypothetical protein